MSKDIDWKKFRFQLYQNRIIAILRTERRKWSKGELTQDNVLHISEGSTALHYGQQCFEGLGAYRCKDGSINLFRPDQNAQRMQASCRRLLMPEIPTEMFVDACKKVVKANEEWLAPYGTGTTLYLCPVFNWRW